MSFPVLPACTRSIVMVLLWLALWQSGGVELFGQSLEMRHLFERFSDWNVQIGANVLGPVRSQLNPLTAESNIPYNARYNFNGYVSVDYWQIRGGLAINSIDAIAPFLFWNPIFRSGFGSDSSRWNGSLGWEGIFARDDNFDPLGNLQADNSVYSPTTSLSLLIGFWAGPQLDSAARRDIIRRAYPQLDDKNLERWLDMRSNIDTNYAGRGNVDTNNYRSLPLDTNSYLRGVDIPLQTPVPYTSRNGFSASVGFGSGKYAGSGPLSRFFNIGAGTSRNNQSDTTKLYSFGLNPMASIRYRFGNYIAQFDIAGEDLNLGVAVRAFRQFDVEGGVKYLEHIVPRPSRGSNRPEFFLGIRYALPYSPKASLYERGEDIYYNSDDSDGDGIPNEIELRVTHTDPNNPDSDGDGISDGHEVFSYKTNPLSPDSDGDGLSDGRELLTPGHRTDPLRADTDEDGINDGEEITNGSDPLIPAGGERGR